MLPDPLFPDGQDHVHGNDTSTPIFFPLKRMPAAQARYLLVGIKVDRSTGTVVTAGVRPSVDGITPGTVTEINTGSISVSGNGDDVDTAFRDMSSTVDGKLVVDIGVNVYTTSGTAVQCADVFLRLSARRN